MARSAGPGRASAASSSTSSTRTLSEWGTDRAGRDLQPQPAVRVLPAVELLGAGLAGGARDRAPFTKITNLHGHTHQVLYNEIGAMRSIGQLATSWPWPDARPYAPRPNRSRRVSPNPIPTPIPASSRHDDRLALIADLPVGPRPQSARSAVARSRSLRTLREAPAPEHGTQRAARGPWATAPACRCRRSRNRPAPSPGRPRATHHVLLLRSSCRSLGVKGQPTPADAVEVIAWVGAHLSAA